jgi:RNA polymerase sigma-70 factor (ECF subfamily)
MPDRDIAEGIQARDERALGLFIERYGFLVRFVVTKRLQALAYEADIVYNDVLLRVWTKIDLFEIKPPPEAVLLRPWVSTIARHAALDMWRRYTSKGKYDLARMQDFEDNDTQAVYQVADPSPSAANLVEAEEMSETVDRLMGGLLPGYEEALRLRLAEVTTRQMSEDLGIPEGTCKTRVFRARTDLERDMRRIGLLEGRSPSGRTRPVWQKKRPEPCAARP